MSHLVRTRICRQLLSQETQLSFSEPELIWIREDQQPQQMHFTEKGMLKRVVKIVRECCDPVIFTNVSTANDRLDLPLPPNGLTYHELENGDWVLIRQPPRRPFGLGRTRRKSW